MPRIRIIPAMIALILTFGVLLGGTYVYRNYDNYSLSQPLSQQVKAIPSVNSVSVDFSTSTPVVTVDLKANADLQTVYGKISNVITRLLSTPVSLIINDHASQSLRHTYDSLIRPIIFTGIAAGDFVSMFRSFHQEVVLSHIQGTITMNGQNIFVSLSQGNKYLYDVIPFTLHNAG